MIQKEQMSLGANFLRIALQCRKKRCNVQSKWFNKVAEYKPAILSKRDSGKRPL